MNIIVCVKRTPEVTDAELDIAKDGQQIVMDDLEFDINEWDNYAVEEAVRLKEVYGGKVTIITLGNEDCEDVLRQGLAMGADDAIRIDDEGFEFSDAVGIAKGLHRVVKDIPFDILLTGVQSSDNGWGQVGLALSELLGLPYASLVVKIEISNQQIIASRELESNMQEKVKLPIPAVLTIQTGINKPRYVSILGIKSVRKIKIHQTNAEELCLSKESIGASASCISNLKLSLPSVEKNAQILKGNLDDICNQVYRIIREKGGLA